MAPTRATLALGLLPFTASFKVFIDGSAGTTGLQVRDRLSGRKDITLVSPPDASRKDPDARRLCMLESDATILCLPDEASKEAGAWLAAAPESKAVLIDASTAFRVDPAWTYGFPELNPPQKAAIQAAQRISNPGCYPTGFISLVHPLTAAGLVPTDAFLTVNAVSGYSGGGKALMEIYEATEPKAEPWGAYGFNLAHKHVPEMAKYAGLTHPPIFHPAVGNFPQGMVVSVPLHYAAQLAPGTTGAQIHACLTAHYQGSAFVKVMPLGGTSEAGACLERGAFLRPDSLQNTNFMELFVFANDAVGQAILCARLDNLGKGASGAAVQNLNLALGLEETAGLL